MLIFTLLFIAINNKIKLINITPKFIKSIDCDSLLYLDASSNYTCLTFKGGTRKVYSYHLKVFEYNVLPKYFIRVNRSRLINISFVKKSLKNGDDHYLILQDNTKVLIPKKRRKELKLRFPEVFGM